MIQTFEDGIRGIENDYRLLIELLGVSAAIPCAIFLTLPPNRQDQLNN